jgi:hypothetical protein
MATHGHHIATQAASAATHPHVLSPRSWTRPDTHTHTHTHTLQALEGDMVRWQADIPAEQAAAQEAAAALEAAEAALEGLQASIKGEVEGYHQALSKVRVCCCLSCHAPRAARGACGALGAAYTRFWRLLAHLCSCIKPHTAPHRTALRPWQRRSRAAPFVVCCRRPLARASCRCVLSWRPGSRRCPRCRAARTWRPASETCCSRRSRRRQVCVCVCARARVAVGVFGLLVGGLVQQWCVCSGVCQ